MPQSLASPTNFCAQQRASNPSSHLNLKHLPVQFKFPSVRHGSNACARNWASRVNKKSVVLPRTVSDIKRPRTVQKSAPWTGPGRPWAGCGCSRRIACARALGREKSVHPGHCRSGSSMWGWRGQVNSARMRSLFFHMDKLGSDLRVFSWCVPVESSGKITVSQDQRLGHCLMVQVNANEARAGADVGLSRGLKGFVLWADDGVLERNRADGWQHRKCTQCH